MEENFEGVKGYIKMILLILRDIKTMFNQA